MDTTYTIKDFLEVKAAGDASFNTDSTKIVYLSNITGTHQIFIASIEGGEPRQLTDFKDPVSFVRPSPIEDIVVFGKAEGGNEKTQFYLLNLTTGEISGLTGKPEVRHDFGAWSPDGKSICFASNERNGKDFDAYVMDVSTLKKRCVFDKGEWCAVEGFSPKSTYIVVQQKHSNTNTDLYLCNLQTGEINHITPHSGNVFYAEALWSPDESAFFFVQDEDREFKALARYNLFEKKKEYVLAPAWDIEGVSMDRTGKSIAITLNEDGYGRVTIYDTKTFGIHSYPIPAGNVYRTRFSEDGSKMAFSLGDSRRTSDIWILDLENGESRQLTHCHQGVSPETMVEPELIRFSSFDGLSVPAFIYKPKNSKKGLEIPAIINIHGGPEAQYQAIYQPVMQYLVYSGYAVIAPNIRGSSGYGKSYLALDDIEKRLDSVKDIVALRDYLAARSDIDVDKIALYGASYGGFMVLACMTIYPKLWAAAIDIVGIANFVTFLENTAPYRRAVREAEYGSLENNRKFLEEISPINSIEKIEAPLFIIHGANDPRVPLSEAEQVVSKLEKLGRSVELLVYQDEGHGIIKLQNKLDAYPKVVEFLNKRLT